MSTVVTARVAGKVEIIDDAMLSIDAPLVTTKPIAAPPFGCKQVKGLPVCSY